MQGNGWEPRYMSYPLFDFYSLSLLLLSIAHTILSPTGLISNLLSNSMHKSEPQQFRFRLWSHACYLYLPEQLYSSVTPTNSCQYLHAISHSAHKSSHPISNFWQLVSSFYLFSLYFLIFLSSPLPNWMRSEAKKQERKDSWRQKDWILLQDYIQVQ